MKKVIAMLVLLNVLLILLYVSTAYGYESTQPLPSPPESEDE